VLSNESVRSSTTSAIVASDLFRSYWEKPYRNLRAGVLPGTRLDVSYVRDEGQIRDLLLLAILVELYFVRPQVTDNLSLFVRYGHVELNQRGCDLDDVRFIRRRSSSGYRLLSAAPTEQTIARKLANKMVFMRKLLS
jgi:hypothetical protein